MGRYESSTSSTKQLHDSINILNQKLTWKLLVGDWQLILLGLGGGQVVNVLAFYSDDQSSNAAEAYSFSVKFVFEKNKNIQKKTHFTNKNLILFHAFENAPSPASFSHMLGLFLEQQSFLQK